MRLDRKKPFIQQLFPKRQEDTKFVFKIILNATYNNGFFAKLKH